MERQLVRRISALRAWNREGKSEENRAEEKEAESVPREAMTTEKEGDQTSSPFALLSSLCTSVDESGDTDRCFLETFYALWPLEFLCSLVRSVSPEVFSQGSFNCDAVEKEKRHCDAVEKEKRNCDAVEKEKRNCDAVEKEKRQRLWESLARLPFHPSLIFFGRADCLDSEAHTATQKMYFESGEPVSFPGFLPIHPSHRALTCVFTVSACPPALSIPLEGMSVDLRS
uniref:Uncharacterized protein n=1 Tax=Chromera velia CCMP2878 TaxID=1169474 RepID=A0A0G4HKY3_9ALVE|eukprot:Cvel_28625.t1-p1 / transcript=Cvel_28625.t1 / gene=Cvel_28625 / organism=Chromera_velia_CCMP2878 / gene_product=hypothetical protein / transcript_product=hypothetical protein / location=Cvel_scaffold3780:7707-13809(+) / protein_length=227 / sequence_SO=supercontig / SO=protein_coding / is_pseudo=false